jgi:hypothetical protein
LGIKTCHAQPLRHFAHIMVNDKFNLCVLHLSDCVYCFWQFNSF